MTALYAIMYKEVLHILRDGRSLVAALAIPVVMLALFGYAIVLDVKVVDIALVDYDHSAASRELVASLGADGAVRVVARPDTEEQLDALIAGSTVRMGLIIPPGYDAGLAAGRDVPVQIIVDGSDATFAGLALGHVGGSLQHAVRTDALDGLRLGGVADELPGLHPVPRVFFNEALNSTWYIIPGLIAVILMMLAAMLTSQCVAREYEQGTIEQILVSPVAGPALMIGKLVPYVVVGLIQVLTVTVAARWLFGVPIRGSLGLLALATVLYLTGSMALGLMLSAALKSQQVAMQISMVATMLPSLLLSGFVFPISNMAWVLQGISYAVPARYYIAITRGLFLKGVDLGPLVPDLIAMVVYATVMLVLAVSGFRRTLA